MNKTGRRTRAKPQFPEQLYVYKAEEGTPDECLIAEREKEMILDSNEGDQIVAIYKLEKVVRMRKTVSIVEDLL